MPVLLACPRAAPQRWRLCVVFFNAAAVSSQLCGAPAGAASLKLPRPHHLLQVAERMQRVPESPVAAVICNSQSVLEGEWHRICLGLFGQTGAQMG